MWNIFTFMHWLWIFKRFKGLKMNISQYYRNVFYENPFRYVEDTAKYFDSLCTKCQFKSQISLSEEMTRDD